MRRIEPAYPDLLPVTHVVRPGYLPGPRVALDPIRMGIVWEDAPRRILPVSESVPRHPVRAIIFSSVASQRIDLVERLLEQGSSLLLVIDDNEIGPEDLGFDSSAEGRRVTPLMPVLPTPLANGAGTPEKWRDYPWGAILGLFPFPDAGEEIEEQVDLLHDAGATFAVAAPLMLTPKDRHRILENCEGTCLQDRLENALFHADIFRGLHAMERRAGVALNSAGMNAYVSDMAAEGCHPSAVRTASRLRLWARRLDQSREESSWGWRLRRAASALEPLSTDPEVLAGEDNLRVIPGFDPWVEEFTRALWKGGEPVEAVWREWSGLETDS